MDFKSTLHPDDRLSRLPVQLLERIFELAYDDEHTTTGALSRALLPFDRVERFKEVRVDTSDELCNLADLFESKSSLPSLVKTLHYHNKEATELPKAFPYERFFSSLSRLSSLTLKGCNHVPATFVLSSAFPSVASSHLFSVTLDIAEDSEAKWDPAHYQHLATIPSLKSLTISEVNTDYDGVFFPDFPEVSSAEPALQQITSLGLSLTSRYSDRSTFTPIFSACPSLRALRITNEIGHDFFEFLEPPTSARSRTFTSGPTLDLEALLELVSGVDRMPALKHLTLDMYEIELGWSMRYEGNGHLHPEHLYNKYHVASDWYMEVYPGQIRPSEVEELEATASAQGVEVTGTVTGAPSVYRFWQEEALECCWTWGKETGDFTDAQVFFDKVLDGEGFGEWLEGKVNSMESEEDDGMGSDEEEGW
ncbi:hypothetical protein JCM10207_007592 [Rhodosporidiobolus poonsookiae]